MNKTCFVFAKAVFRPFFRHWHADCIYTCSEIGPEAGGRAAKERKGLERREILRYEICELLALFITEMYGKKIEKILRRKWNCLRRDV